MEKMKKVRAEISKTDAAEKFAKFYGLDIFLGNAKFTGRNTISINGRELSFSKACIATGARPRVPSYPGLNDVKFYTSDSIFNLVV